jgi:DNA gyrase/topoisomerase IV subunit A
MRLQRLTGLERDKIIADYECNYEGDCSLGENSSF